MLLVFAYLRFRACSTPTSFPYLVESLVGKKVNTGSGGTRIVRGGVEMKDITVLVLGRRPRSDVGLEDTVDQRAVVIV